MILLDTHAWVWWVHGARELPSGLHALIESHVAQGLGVSEISCWEIAKLVQLERLVLPFPVSRWMGLALAYPGIRLLPLTPEISVASTQLPGSFHRDPADQIIVATSRVLGFPLVTVDKRILAYEHVETLKVGAA